VGPMRQAGILVKAVSIVGAAIAYRRLDGYPEERGGHVPPPRRENVGDLSEIGVGKNLIHRMADNPWEKGKRRGTFVCRGIPK